MVCTRCQRLVPPNAERCPHCDNELLSKLGYIEESELTAFLSRQYGVPSINLEEFNIDPGVIDLVPYEVAVKHYVVPVNRAGASLIVALADPSNIFAISDLKSLTGRNIEVVVATDDAIRKAIHKYYLDTEHRSPHRWCFKCQKSVDSAPGKCPSCGSQLGAVHDGERVGPSRRVTLADLKARDPSFLPNRRRNAAEVGTQIVARLKTEGMIKLRAEEAEVALEVIYPIVEYFNLEARVDQETALILERRGLAPDRFEVIRKGLAKVRNLEIGEDGIEFLVKKVEEALNACPDMVEIVAGRDEMNAAIAAVLRERVGLE